MKPILILTLCLALAACSGQRRGSFSAPLQTAEGPIKAACLASGRKASSRELCGCIQFAANLTLTASDQSRAAAFYSDPQTAQDTRQSDRASDESFWGRYKAYASTSEQICRG
jgi:hypothetical protein